MAYILSHAREWIGQLCGGMNTLCAIWQCEGVRIDSQPSSATFLSTYPYLLIHTARGFVIVVMAGHKTCDYQGLSPAPCGEDINIVSDSLSLRRRSCSIVLVTPLSCMNMLAKQCTGEEKICQRSTTKCTKIDTVRVALALALIKVLR
jgi:hypothetical protein